MMITVLLRWGYKKNADTNYIIFQGTNFLLLGYQYVSAPQDYTTPSFEALTIKIHKIERFNRKAPELGAFLFETI